MDMHVILRRISVRAKEMGVKEATISRHATGSPDTIRNWRRRLEREDEVGASMVTLQKVAAVLERSVEWLMGEGPETEDEIDLAEERRQRIISLYDSLPPDRQSVAERQIEALVDLEKPASPKKPQAAQGPSPKADRPAR